QWSNVIALGYGAFPIPWKYTDTSHKDCREFQNQLLPPLLECPRINFKNVLDLLDRIGWFLNDEGKLRDAEAIHCKAYMISNESNGDQDTDALSAMSNLASTYLGQGRTAEAAELE